MNISLAALLLIAFNFPHEQREKMEVMMSAKEGQGVKMREDQKPVAEESPSEKIEGKQPPGSTVPGAENPDSEEIKGEINPNTE